MNIIRIFSCVLGVVAAVTLISCESSQTTKNVMQKKFPTTSPQVSFSQLAGWEKDDHGAALEAFQKSCHAARKRGGLQARSKGFSEKLCLIAQQTAPFNAKEFFEENFEPVIGNKTKAHFTAYYEPTLKGSRTYSPPYIYPIYAKPPELKKGKPFFTRAQINNKALEGRGLELLYLADPVEAFFLHVQGSGRIELPDGRTTRVGFAGKNGHAYRSIGKEMIARGYVTSGASAQVIKDWVRDNPIAGQKLLEHNESYVFFHEIDSLSPTEGPVGALGVPLTPMRSIAVDPVHVLLGLPVWVNLQTVNEPQFSKLMIAQDVGSAIKGQTRGDLFFGTGDEAGFRAGQVNTNGDFIVLRPRKRFFQISQNKHIAL